MKLLFDQNLSFKLCRQLADIFPGSSQVRLFGMDEADDQDIWEYAKTNGFTLVSQDADFADMATLFGPPPKVIWLRCGNQPTAELKSACAIMRKRLLTSSKTTRPLAGKSIGRRSPLLEKFQ